MKLDKKKIPQKCGVYFFHDKREQILYIGKAANLRNRLKSYLSYRDTNSRTIKMLELTAKIDWQETDSEIEALILESQLIKKHCPPFNIMLRDDKQYFYIGITQEQFPRVFITHQPQDKRLVKTRNKISTLNATAIPQRSTRNNVPGVVEPSTSNRSTLNADYIGPFTDGDALKTTLRLLRRIFPYCTCKQKHNNYCLNYHIGKCLGFCCLKQQNLNFQKEYKKNIKAIKDVLSGKRGSLIKKLKKEMVDLGKMGKFEGAAKLRDQIKKLEKVFKNAQILLNAKYLILNTKSGQKQTNPLTSLQNALNLPCLPYRIEGYDVSNIQGRFATGAMAVFVNGRPDKSQYRKFKIRMGNRPNDTAMLKEVLMRRFNHPEWPYPDLIVIDGGRNQLGAAERTAKDYGPEIKIKQVKIIALTKDRRHKGSHIYIINKKASIPLKKLSESVRNLILQVNAEAHRFAISYYRKLHRKLEK